MAGAFDDESDQGAFQRDPMTLPNPFPDRFSDADWQLAMQRYSDLARFASPQDIPFGAVGPITNPFWQARTALPFAQLAAAANVQDQLALQPAGATNPLDLSGIGGNPNAASNPLDLSSIGGPAAQPSQRGDWFMDPSDKRSQFFDKNYAPAATALAPYNVDPALPLAVAALESGWGTSDQAQRLGNPLGYLPGGRAAQFGSPEAAWQAWARTYGPRVQDVGGDVERFVQNLQLDNRNAVGPTIGGDYRGPYNSEDAQKINWPDGVTKQATWVRHWLPRWRGNYDGLP